MSPLGTIGDIVSFVLVSFVGRFRRLPLVVLDDQ
jgi:hypothetical protein